MDKISMSAKLNEILYFAGNCFPGYPYCRAKDPGYFELLLEEFIELDLLQELKLYSAWTLDRMEEGPIPYRTLFRLWLKHSHLFRVTRVLNGEDGLC